MAKVAIVGKPNVGKSSLFNRLLGRREAIVADKPGVTRDVKEVRLEPDEGKPFYLLDTGGLWSGDEWDELIKRRVEYALRDTDLVLFCVDGRDDLSSADYEIAEWLRSLGKEILLVATKIDHPKHEQGEELFELYSLGFGEPYHTSAEQSRGFHDLLAAIDARLPKDDLDEADAETVRVAIIGRPNAGKSSLLNALIGDERVIVADVAGTTRDSIDVRFEFGGRPFVLIDTAGIRRKATEDVEFYSKLRAELSVNHADVNILVVDPFELGDHEFRIANIALEIGKPVVVAINKWDLVPDEKLKEMEAHLAEVLSHLQQVPWVYISALNSYGLHELLAATIRVYTSSRQRISTSELNNWLTVWTQRQSPPNFRGRSLKLFYGTQADIAPPTFIISVNTEEFVTRAYENYILNRIREDLGFKEVPVRLIFKSRTGEKRMRVA
ncbi:MAG: ribosome biogenesis GTPase Der [Deinococcales bacterium]